MGEFLVQCHSLKTLDFSNTQLRSANGVYMFSAINGRSSLQELILANTGVSNQAIQQLCVKKQQYLTYLQVLDLSGNQTLTAEACPALQSFVKLQRRFRALDLTGCSNLGDGIILVFEALQWPSADQLAREEEKERRDKVRSQERKQKLMELGKGVQNLLTYDKVIVKNDGGIQIKPKPQEEEPACEYTTALTSLVIDGVKLNSAALEQLGGALEKNQSLERLSMSNCSLDFNKEDLTAAMQTFCAAVQGHKSLQYLDLSKNSFSDNAAAQLALLVNSPSLVDLNLAFTRIGDRSVIAIAANLQGATSVMRLNLRGNGCESEGAQAMQVAIQKNPHIQFCDLQLNKIRFQMAEKIEQLVRQNIDQSQAQVLQTL